MQAERSLIVTSDIASAAIALGAQLNMAFVCRMCTHWWDAVQANKSDCGIESCFGPISGGDFRSYSGPLSNLASVCFVCGDAARHGIATAHGSRIVGVCDKHLSMLDRRWRANNGYNETGKSS